MELKLYLMCLLEVVGALLVIAPIIVGVHKSVSITKATVTEKMFADICGMVGKAMSEVLNRGENKDDNERG